MVEVYFHIPAEKAETVVECGMKLSEWHDREVTMGGESKKCISALLNPRDDNSAFRSPDYRCVKLEVHPRYCFVADRFLYRLGLCRPEASLLYEKSVVPVEQYRFGTYREPECLIACTVVGDSISLLDRRLDSPILFENSEELYFNNLMESLKEANPDYNDLILYYLLNALVAAGKVLKTEDGASGLAVFTEEGGCRVYTVKIPDLGRYCPPGL